MASLWVNNTVYRAFPSCSSARPPLLGADTDQSVPLEGCGGWNRGRRGHSEWGVAFCAVLKQCFLIFSSFNCSLLEVSCSHSCWGSCLKFYLKKGGLGTHGCSPTVTHMLVTSDKKWLFWPTCGLFLCRKVLVSGQSLFRKSYETQCGYEKMVRTTSLDFFF